MSRGYQDRDEEVIDYQLWKLRGIFRELRGPALPSIVSGEYATCVGAAQTFGCYSEQPYPALLSDATGLPFLNFGVAGASPYFFTDKPVFIKYINEGRFAIVQIMSGRSVSNSLFTSTGGETLTRNSDGVRKDASSMFQELLDTGDKVLIKKVVEESRSALVEGTIELLNAIKVPKILLWVSKRRPTYWPRYNKSANLFGDFPQLVNKKMVNIVREHADFYVQHASTKGMPQKLISRHTGKSASTVRRDGLESVNNYYPTPQMHRDVFLKLDKVIRDNNIL